MSRKKIIRYTETIFDSAYLCTVLMTGVYILVTAKSAGHVLFGIMALILVSGDLCHLAPRIALSFCGNTQRFLQALGTGKMIASVSMTLFYVFLWHIGILSFSPSGAAGLTIPVYLVAAIRVVLTLLPQNRWGQDASPARWHIYRNVPFILLGCAVGFLFFIYRHSGVAHLRWMWLAILLSFAFYIPVVLGARKYPALGMLMLPKSCVYVWIITMGL